MSGQQTAGKDATVRRLMDENERLERQQVEDARQYSEMLQAQKREIERLQAALEQVVQDADSICASVIVISPETLAMARAALG